MESRMVYTITQGLEKARKYCAYQERSHSEVRQKLYAWRLYPNEVEHIITQLIEDGYLNEERFARAFARGKFRLKQWGRVKIIHALKLKDISKYAIEIAMSEIDEDEYRKTLSKLIKKKTASLKTGSALEKKVKTLQYCMSRGFERALIESLYKGGDD